MDAIEPAKKRRRIDRREGHDDGDAWTRLFAIGGDGVREGVVRWLSARDRASLLRVALGTRDAALARCIRMHQLACRMFRAWQKSPFEAEVVMSMVLYDDVRTSIMRREYLQPTTTQLASVRATVFPVACGATSDPKTVVIHVANRRSLMIDTYRCTLGYFCGPASVETMCDHIWGGPHPLAPEWTGLVEMTFESGIGTALCKDMTIERMRRIPRKARPSS